MRVIVLSDKREATAIKDVATAKVVPMGEDGYASIDMTKRNGKREAHQYCMAEIHFEDDAPAPASNVIPMRMHVPWWQRLADLVRG